MFYFSAQTKGFYTAEIHGDNIPPDAVEITTEKHNELLDGQATGKRIIGDENGNPILADQPPPTTEELIEQLRQRRDQLLTESDWTQAADIPQATKDRWAPYRQALRDVPQQPGFPTDVIWPQKP